MKKFISHFYDFSCNFIHLLALFFTGLLLVSGFLFTCYADDMTSQLVLTRVDNPLFNLFGTCVMIVLLLLCAHFACKNPSKGKKILSVMVFGWILALGGLLILFGKTVPAADAWSVYEAAENLSMGNTSVIHPTDSYLSYYPQQVGLMAFFELLIRLWKLFPVDLHAYHFIKCLYVILTCVIVYFQYRTVHLLWKEDKADCIYLILAGCNLPLIMYSSFVYGETPSFAAMSVGIYYLLRLLKGSPENKKIPYALCSLITLTLAVMLRKNTLIIIIAVVLVTLLEALKRKSRSLLLFAALCLICSLSILPVIQKAYELRSGSTLRSGVPAMSYFAMGMQEASRGNGWYNGYNFDTYQESGMDSAAASETSRQFMKERMEYFRSHPGDAIDFYWNKYLSQWADGTYASRQATLATFGGRNALAESFYTGKNSRLYIEYCNIYQNILYLGCFAGFMAALLKRKKSPIYLWLGMIGAFGGFLFHMIWEANSRYIFLYGLLLLPYAANGIAELSNMFGLGRFRKNNTDHKSDAKETQAIAG